MPTEEKSGAELFAEREQRIQDCIALRETDRVPFSFFAHFWPATLAGMSFKDAMYDYERFNDAVRQSLNLLEPDEYSLTQISISLGPTLEMMDYKQLEWPGHGTDPNTSYQYIDKEYMRADEYDDYLMDPTYMPRVAGVFEPFTRMPLFPSLFYTKMVKTPTAFAHPELFGAFEKIADAGCEMRSMMKIAFAFAGEMAEAGYPQSQSAVGAAPFDHFADYLRGSKGAMLDMFRNRDKLLAAMDKAAYFIARDAIESVQRTPCKVVFIPLHWGLDGFMSPDQFETFFWPPLRKVMMMLIEADLTPLVLWEGDCETRLGTIADIPKGKAVYWFEKTNLIKAKQVLGDTVCLRGNVPSSMLTTGTPEDVDEYCAKMIREVGKGGGFIMDGAVGIPDEAKPENVVAMAQSVHKHSPG